MKGQLPFDGKDRFKYIIITPCKKEKETMFNTTYFNQISYSIIDSLMALNFISYFPATFTEFFSEWPYCSCNYYRNSEYDISYLNEVLINENFLDFIENIELGLLFISEGIDEEVIKKILIHSRIPIVMLDLKENDNVFNISKESISKIYNLFYEKIKEKAINLPNNCINMIDNIKSKDTNNIPYISPIAKYLDPLTFTLDRIRGLYSSCGSGIYKIHPVYPKVHEKYENMADEEINKVVKRIIAEKFLILMLGIIEEGSFDSKDEKKLEEIGLSKELLDEFLLKRDNDIYNSISDKIYDNLEYIKFKSNMTICVPSVNYEYIRCFFSKDLIGKEYRKISKEAFRLSYDMNTYYGLLNTEVFIKETEIKKQHNVELAIHLLSQRGAENTFLSLLYVFLTLSHRDPFIRTRNVPASKIWSDLKRLIDLITNNDTYLKAKDINPIIASVSDVLMEQIFNETNELEKIIYEYADHITIVSDLPVEWVKLKKVPMCIRKKMSRIPITPGDNLASFIQVNKESYEISSKNIKILIINALSGGDPLYRYGDILNNNLIDVFGNKNNVKEYIVVNDKKEYIEAINKIKPNILIHFGHGDYNRWDKNKSVNMAGCLVINEEILTIEDIDKITHFPKIVILGACNTEVVQGPNYNIANTFLASGCLSVLGTFVPVNADYTVDFITNIINTTYMCLSNKSSDIISDWADIILLVRKKMYIEEPIYCLSHDYKKGKLKSEVDKFKPIEKFIHYCEEKNISTEDAIEKRNEIFCEIFKGNSELYNSFNNIVSSKSIAPYTMFYTSLGSPEKIQVIR